jgi:hypothetical protein
MPQKLAWAFPFLQLHNDCRVNDLHTTTTGEYAMQKLPELHKFCLKFLSLYSAQLNRISIIGDIVNDPVSIRSADLPEVIVFDTLREMAIAQHIMNIQMINIEEHRHGIIRQTMQQIRNSSTNMAMLHECMTIFNRFLDVHQVGSVLISDFISGFCESKKPHKPGTHYRHMIGMHCINKFILLRILHSDIIATYNMAHRLLSIGNCSVQYINFYRVLIKHMELLIGNQSNTNNMSTNNMSFSRELAKNIALLTNMIGAVIN